MRSARGRASALHACNRLLHFESQRSVVELRASNTRARANLHTSCTRQALTLPRFQPCPLFAAAGSRGGAGGAPLSLCCCCCCAPAHARSNRGGTVNGASSPVSLETTQHTEHARSDARRLVVAEPGYPDCAVIAVCAMYDVCCAVRTVSAVHAPQPLRLARRPRRRTSVITRASRLCCGVAAGRTRQ